MEETKSIPLNSTAIGGGGMIPPLPFQSLPSKINVPVAGGGGRGDDGNWNTSNANKKRRLPTPKELVAYYESQGMEAQAASLKVIEDLQNVIFKVVSTSSSGRGGAGAAGDSGVVGGRLVKLETKLDSKPGYRETLVLGVASGALLRGIGSVLPQVASALTNIWDSVRRSSSNPPSN